jgi:hypothetical protein
MIEIRRDADGFINELLADGDYFMHLENMGDAWTLAIDTPHGNQYLFAFATSRDVPINLVEIEINAKTGTEFQYFTPLGDLDMPNFEVIVKHQYRNYLSVVVQARNGRHILHLTTAEARRVVTALTEYLDKQDEAVKK